MIYKGKKTGYFIVQSAGGGLARPSWAAMRNPVLSCRFTQGESEK